MPSLLKLCVTRWREATADSRVLPDFLIIGAQRSGTSTLYQSIARHPCVGRALRKEVHFFDHNFDKGLPWYRARFPTVREKARRVRRHGAFVTGESSPSYLIHAEAPARVARVLPEAKLIAILRNPVERAYSQYHRNLRVGRERQSFAEAVAAGNEALEFAYLARGRYAEHFERWLKLFKREQLLVLGAENFFREPMPVLGRVFSFLGIPAWEGDPTMQRWVAKKYSYDRYAPMDEAVRRQLMEYYRPHNERLYRLAGENFGWDSAAG